MLDATTLSLLEQIGQLFVVRASGFGQDNERRYPQWELSQADLALAIQEFHVGGVLLYGGELKATSTKILQLQHQSKIPLLICADVEAGCGQHFEGATHLPTAMALGKLGVAACYQAGLITAREALAIGVNWVLAPVADVNINSQNPVINVRAFGASTAEVIQFSTSFLAGLQAGGVLTCAKHFPGHGDVSADSHLELPVVTLDLNALTKIHLLPFQELIACGVDTVMAAHLLVPALAPEPMSLSHTVLTKLLQTDWGFKGLIVTDALTMQAITHQYTPGEAAVLALEAGADILLMPDNLVAAYQGVYAAVLSGRIPESRILHSAQKILNTKTKITLSPPLTPGDWQSHQQQARELFESIVNLYPLPVIDSRTEVFNLIITTPEPKDIAILHQLSPQTQVLTQDSELLEGLVSTSYPFVLVHLMLQTGPYHSLTQLAAHLHYFLEEQAKHSSVLVLNYGNPYLTENLSPAIKVISLYTTHPMMQQAVVAALSRQLRNID